MTDQIDEKALKEAKARILKGSQKYAEKMGYELNPDSEIVKTIITGLAKNKLRHGRAYCPCMFVTGNPDEDKKIICPCKVHHEDIEKSGRCHCGLFVQPD